MRAQNFKSRVDGAVKAPRIRSVYARSSTGPLCIKSASASETAQTLCADLARASKIMPSFRAKSLYAAMTAKFHAANFKATGCGEICAKNFKTNKIQNFRAERSEAIKFSATEPRNIKTSAVEAKRVDFDAAEPEMKFQATESRLMKLQTPRAQMTKFTTARFETMKFQGAEPHAIKF